MENNHSAKNMWGDYLDSHLEHAFVEAPKIIQLGATQEEVNTAVKMIKEGSKRAITNSLLGLQYRKEPLPKLGAFLVVTDWQDKAQCIIRLTSVKLKPYFSIDAAYVQLEGESSVERWKSKYWDSFSKELEPFERLPRESMIVVCQTFEKVFQ